MEEKLRLAIIPKEVMRFITGLAHPKRQRATSSIFSLHKTHETILALQLRPLLALVCLPPVLPIRHVRSLCKESSRFLHFVSLGRQRRIVVEEFQRVHGLSSARALECEEGEVPAHDGPCEEVGAGKAAAALGLVEVGEGAV